MTIAPSRSEAGPAALEARLHDPDVTKALVELLDHAELLALLLGGLDGLLARSEVIGESLIDGVSELRSAIGDAAVTDSGVDAAAVLQAGLQLAAVAPAAAPGLVAVVQSGAIDKLTASGALGEEAVDQVATLARGVAAGSRDFASDPVRVGGPVSVLKLIKDPDINRAISFLATVARGVGRELAAAMPAGTVAATQQAASSPHTAVAATQ